MPARPSVARSAGLLPAGRRPPPPSPSVSVWPDRPPGPMATVTAAGLVPPTGSAPSRPVPTPPSRSDVAGDDRRGGADLAEASAAAHHAQGGDETALASGPPWPVLRASCPRKTLTRADDRRPRRGRPSVRPPPLPIGVCSVEQPARRPEYGPSCRQQTPRRLAWPSWPGSAGVVPAGPARSAPK